MHGQLSDVQAWADPAVMAKAVLCSGHLAPTSAGAAGVTAGWAEQADGADVRNHAHASLTDLSKDECTEVLGGGVGAAGYSVAR